jgi:hypothetical protein
MHSTHLYMLCYRCEALVASHLDPEAFGRYMAVGTQKLNRGHVAFFEVDRNLGDGYFSSHDIDKRCEPHPDGSPKRSRYISVYRVLEHLSLAQLGKLYLTTIDGRVLAIEASAQGVANEEHGPNLYQELCPLTPMVVSALSPSVFCAFMTDPRNSISVPRIFFADLLLDRDESGHLAGYLPYAEPMHILHCIQELALGVGKPTKTVTRDPHTHSFFRTIRRGFFVGDQQGMKFYPFPNLRQLEVEHAHWWRSASSR